MEPFTKLRVLGKGSHSVVSLVRRNSDSQIFALKKVLLDEPSSLPAVSSECSLLNTLKHPNVVKLHQATVQDDHLALLLEFADGGDLQMKIKQKQAQGCPFSQQEVFHILAQITLALKYIHRKNVIHRDLKPNNVLCMKDGLVKISDFGISTQLGPHKFTQTNVGTPYYLAPEVVNNSPYDYKVDIWMLGCTLYELCTLRKPFQGANLPEILFKIVKEEPEPIPQEMYSSQLRSLITRMLSKDPEMRPSAEEILGEKEVQQAVIFLGFKF